MLVARETKVEVGAVAKAIAVHLDGWQAVEKRNPCHDGCVSWELQKEGGYAVSISAPDWSHSDRGKLRFSGNWPRDNGHNQYRDEDVSSVMVSGSKPPAQIAKEIKRRLLDRYVTAYDAQLVRLNAANDRLAKRLEVAARLCAILGDTNTDCNGNPTSDCHVYKRGCNKLQVSVDGSEVQIETRYIPTAVAERVLQLLAESVTE